GSDVCSSDLKEHRMISATVSSIVLGIIQLADETEFDPNDVTPTWVGFLITFLIAVATVVLIWDMVRRIRRTRYRGEVRERLEAERAAEAAGSDDPSDPDASA